MHRRGLVCSSKLFQALEELLARDLISHEARWLQAPSPPPPSVRGRSESATVILIPCDGWLVGLLR